MQKNYHTLVDALNNPYYNYRINFFRDIIHQYDYLLQDNMTIGPK